MYHMNNAIEHEDEDEDGGPIYEGRTRSEAEGETMAMGSRPEFADIDAK